jgi:hypothetical protein
LRSKNTLVQIILLKLMTSLIILCEANFTNCGSPVAALLARQPPSLSRLKLTGEGLDQPLAAGADPFSIFDEYEAAEQIPLNHYGPAFAKRHDLLTVSALFMSI